jgi:hypothetical protein
MFQIAAIFQTVLIIKENVKDEDTFKDTIGCERFDDRFLRMSGAAGTGNPGI